MNSLIFFFSLIISLNFLIIYKINYLSKILNIVDKPDGVLKKHSKKVFLMGGPIIFLNLSVLFIFFLIDKNFEKYFFHLNFYSEFIIFYFMSTCFFFIGFIDDKFKVNPNTKFIIFIIILTALIFLDTSILLKKISIFNTFLFIENNFVSFFFTIFCFLAFINAFNFFDGINLQAGLYSIFLILIFILNDYLVIFWLTLLICVIFYLYLNFKNHSFLGDSGSLLLSFIFGYFFVSSHNSLNLFKADEIFLVMILPGLDMIRLTTERFLNKKNPLYGDRMHIHHLVEKKYNPSYAPVITILLSSLPFICYSVFKNSILVILFSMAFYVFFIFYLKKSHN